MGERKIIPWEQVTLANKFMFNRVMTANPNLCRRFIEHLLHIEIERIEPPSEEHTMDIAADVHGIRLDVYVKGTNQVFDLEMQVANTKNLPKRARYYQGIMDESEFKPGQNYRTLKDSYVMFICLFDPFGKGLPVYTFQNRCDEQKDLLLGDKTWKVFYNVTDWERLLDKEEQAIFRFILDGIARSDFTKDLGEQVRIARRSPQTRKDYMTWEEYGDEIREEAHAEGVTQGAHDKAIETARAMLAEGLAEDMIARVTQLPAEEVAQLLQTVTAVAQNA